MTGFTKEPWHIEQRREWDELIRLGWKFSYPPPSEHNELLVGLRLTMSRGGFTATFQLPQVGSPRYLQTKMLKLVKTFAEAVGE